MFIDAHTHLQMEEFKNSVDSITRQCIEDGVLYINNVGYNIQSSKAILDLKFPKQIKTFSFAGIHPHYAKEIDKIEELKELLKSKQFNGIGEIGIDRYWYKKDKDILLQKELFVKQLKIAEELQIPVMLHVRNAYKDVFDILNNYHLKMVCFHSFSGEKEELEYIVEKKYFFGINGIITFKNSVLKHILKREYFNYMLIETDAPYLTPMPYRGKRNRPNYVIYIYKFISEYFSIDEEELANIIKENFFNFIGK